MSAFERYETAKAAGMSSIEELDALLAAARAEVVAEMVAQDEWESHQDDMLKPGPVEDDPDWEPLA